jgi:hypothetical protein
MKKPEMTKSEVLMQQIKAGEMPFNDANNQEVSEEFSRTYYWQQAFKEARLESLPDPEGLTGAPGIFEQWIIHAFISRGVSRKDVKRRLEKLKSELRKHLQKNGEPL